jgi:hypothetical protein
VLSVSLNFVALVYLPALFARLVHSAGIIVDLLFPWTAIRLMIRLGQEYVVSSLAVVVAATVIGVLLLTAGDIPVVGELLVAAGAVYLIPAVAFVLGRLTARKRHLL